MYQLKRKDLQAPLPHLSVCNSGPLVFLGIDYQTFLHTQHPCAQADSCSNVQGKCWPWHSKHIKLSSSSQVSLLKTTTPTDCDRFLHLSSSLGNTQAITHVPANARVLSFTYMSNHTNKQWEHPSLQSSVYI